MKGDFMWAVAQMKEGKKVKRKGWEGAEDILTPIQLESDLMFIDSKGERKYVGLIGVEAIDWELVEDKPKSLSDKMYDVDKHTALPNKSYRAEDVQEHLKRFLDYFERNSIGAEHIKEKAKEEFGDRLT